MGNFVSCYYYISICMLYILFYFIYIRRKHSSISEGCSFYVELSELYDADNDGSRYQLLVTRSSADLRNTPD